MATTKRVKFLRPYLLGPDESASPVEDGFWTVVRDHLSPMTSGDRTFRLSGGAEYYGVAGVGFAPAVDYVRIGRLRPRADWPDTIDANGNLDALVLTDGWKLFEGAFIVPAGSQGLFAYMGPLRGVLGMKAVEAWLVQALDLSQRGYSLELRPVIDEAALERLAESEGVSKLTVTVPADSTPEEFHEKDPVGRALGVATGRAASGLDVTMSWSHGHRKPGAMKDMLKSAAGRLARTEGPSKIEVSILVPTAEGIRTETHDLIKDAITMSAVFHVEDTDRLSVDDVLTEIEDVIQRFREGER